MSRADGSSFTAPARSSKNKIIIKLRCQNRDEIVNVRMTKACARARTNGSLAHFLLLVRFPTPLLTGLPLTTTAAPAATPASTSRALHEVGGGRQQLVRSSSVAVPPLLGGSSSGIGCGTRSGCVLGVLDVLVILPVVVRAPIPRPKRIQG